MKKQPTKRIIPCSVSGRNQVMAVFTASEGILMATFYYFIGLVLVWEFGRRT